MRLRYALLPFLAFPAQAQEAPEMPTMLFDVGVGSVYEYPPAGADENAVGTFPVKRLVSEQLSLHRGLSLYFEPLTESGAFPFSEIAQESGDYPISSYRLHVFPIIPRDVTTLADLRELNLPQRVTMIEWSRGHDQQSDGGAYTWALNLCKTIEANLGMEPEITDIVERDTYRCVFSSDERELEVTSAVGRTIQLSLADEVEDQQAADVQYRIRKLEIEEQRRQAEARRTTR
jgi:hypothetical protein